MESDPYTGPLLGAESLDADVLASGEVFAGASVLLRHNYNLLCALYDVREEASGKRKLLLLFPRMVGTDPDFATRFNETCARLRGLRINGLISVENYGQHDGRFFIEYAHFAGDCLSRWMHEPMPQATMDSAENASAAEPQRESTPKAISQNLSEALVKEMMLSVGNALQRLHREGIHHYNLTLTSVLFDGDKAFRLWGAGLYEMIGKPLFERLVSAGIPPIIGKERRRLLDPVAGMSPEMRAGKPPDPRADIHGLALIAYEFIAGRLPAAPIQPPSELHPGISEHWDPTLLKALAKQPEQRQETVEGFLRELEGKKVLPPSAWQKRRNSFLGSLRVFLLRHALGLGALLLVTIAALFFFNWTHTDKQPTPGNELTQAPLRAVRSAAQATHLLQLSPPTAVVSSLESDAPEFRPNDEGQLFLIVPGNQGRIRIQAEGFHSEDWILRDSGSQLPNTLQISLKPELARVQISARPESTVFWRLSNNADEEAWRKLGSVGESGSDLFDTNLPAGTHNLEVRHPHYRTVRFTAVEFPADQLIALKAEQERRPAGLHIISEPAGASVFVNGENIGQAPLRIEGMVFSGPAELRIEHVNHHPYSTLIEPEPGSWLRIEAPPLERMTRAIPARITASDVSRELLSDESTRIRINNQALTPHADDNQLVLPLGQVELEISHPDYTTQRTRMQVTETQPAALSLVLEAKPAQLRLETVPSEVAARLEVNGVAMPFSTTLNLAPGKEHSLRVILDGHEASAKTFMPAANQQLTWRIAPEKLASATPGSAWTFPYSDMRFVWLNAGTFSVGSARTEPHRLPNENDGTGRQAEAVISHGFWMTEVPITQAFYAAITGENPSRVKHPEHPVESITWQQANAFARLLTEREQAAGRLPDGFEFRLPTQLEWEFACRAGSSSPFSWGDNATPNQGNFRGVYPRDPDRAARYSMRDQPTPVRTFSANGLGLYDMHGNVREFTLDPYNDRYPNQPRLIDWMETRSSEDIVVRGGSWQEPPERARSAARERMGRNQADALTGFRLVLAPSVGSR